VVFRVDLNRSGFVGNCNQLAAEGRKSAPEASMALRVTTSFLAVAMMAVLTDLPAA
jgi:hypothetical protein